MRILLVGEFSNAHNNLAQGLRDLGHEVTVASNGNRWLGYKRDINLLRIIENGAGLGVKIRNILHLAAFLTRLCLALPRMRGYDVVQLINPVFFDLKPERLFWFYRYLRRHNKVMVLGVYGTDYYYLDAMMNRHLLRYSAYHGGDEREQEVNRHLRTEEWYKSAKASLNQEIARDCDAIVACCYEYWLPYKETADTDYSGRLLREKLFFVPLPIITLNTTDHNSGASLHDRPLQVFIGVSSIRATFKGADIMVRAAADLAGRYPERIVINKVENVPFATYQKIMASSDVVIDQIYSYGPGMNALLAMSEGKIVIGGGEPEHYEMIGESECKPIINTEPTYDSLYRALESLVLHPERIPELKRLSREYVIRNHNHVNVAKLMAGIYEKCLSWQASSPLSP